MSDSNRPTTLCPNCQQPLPSPAALAYRNVHWRSAIMRDTPPEVWAQYAADGIGLPQAVAMEMSYTG